MNQVIGNINSNQNLAFLKSCTLNTNADLDYNVLVSAFPDLPNLDIREVSIQVVGGSGVLAYINSIYTPTGLGVNMQNGDLITVSLTELLTRSEERRVGKEC